MACSSCGGGSRRMAEPRPIVRAQPQFPNVRLTGAGSPGGAQASNPNTPLQPQAPKRTQV